MACSLARGVCKFENKKHKKQSVLPSSLYSGEKGALEDELMALHPDFPESPHALLDSKVRWFPADEALRESSKER